jgi:ADP-ribosyl-[dinitrogen reductase] hydrolase
VPTTLPPLTLQGRARGALLGLACGDTLGAQVEFLARDTFPPVSDVVGGGPHALRPGDWTDDTSLAACLAESLVTCRGHDPHDQLTRDLAWRREGHLSSKGRCFDIGGATTRALDAFARTGEPHRTSDGRDGGNGSLMRLAPVALAWWDDLPAAIAHAALQSRTTHAHPAAVDACQVMAVLLVQALQGASKEAILASPRAAFADDLTSLHPDVRPTAEGAYLGWKRDAVRSGGYAADSLAAACWCFARTASFEACVLEAANLGHDADTTAAIAGMLAGAHYGERAIPQAWRFLLWGHDWLAWHAEALCARGAAAWSVPGKPCPPPPDPARSGEQTQHVVDGMVLGGRTLVDAVKKVWAQGLAQASPEDEGPLWVDPDLPVWGNIDPDEVR